MKDSNSNYCEAKILYHTLGDLEHMNYKAKRLLSLA